MAQTSGFDPTSQVKTCFDCKMFDVTNRVACLDRENGPGGMPSHEALSVSPQGALPSKHFRVLQTFVRKRLAKVKK